ncbi:putative vacuolar protein sorting-associated protein TDA6 [Grifola frondosa]|uniref:Putative vacuolar protein sorting-associated protein TDA6 n=1 Tax=Grifola frondosa TaxID=5627 RepID=A0A1C7MQV2_GRIFR|nr:putative vacuolar protein sorting-associated protein TDA6 [Grifola frondosa]
MQNSSNGLHDVHNGRGVANGIPDWPHGQLEGPGMPVARHFAVPADPVDGVLSGAGEGDGEADDGKTYCFCNGVSYGAMIGCDDENCEREWFHLPCVGLATPPIGLETKDYFRKCAVNFQTISSLSNVVFLTSKDDVLTQPAWMTSANNKPDSRGHSSAPATIICVEKEGGILDAFFFYFYSFNSGSAVLDVIRFDDHIGDWEHSMVRFVNNKPAFIYLSAHSGGSAYTFDALPTTNSRPTTFIAGGTHANYATIGDHFHELPPPLLFDTTDVGPLWDPTLNFRGFWFDNSTEGAGWLTFEGMWGDQQYPIGEHGQYCIDIQSFSDCRFTDGPTGPVAKNLGRVGLLCV